MSVIYQNGACVSFDNNDVAVLKIKKCMRQCIRELTAHSWIFAAVMTASLFSARGMMQACAHHTMDFTYAYPRHSRDNAAVNASELMPQRKS